MPQVKSIDIGFRLEAYERNKDFGREKLENVFDMFTPSSDQYEDINSDTVLPTISLPAVDPFLHIYSKTLTEDSKNLYTNRFLLMKNTVISN